MTLHSYLVSVHPRWDSYPENLRREYLPKLQAEFDLMCSGKIGRAKVRFMAAYGYRHHPCQVTFDMVIEALQAEGVLP